MVASRGPRPRLRPEPTSTGSGRCSSRSRRSASARRTRPPSPCRPTTRRGSRPTTRRPSSPACSPTTRACTPSGSSSTTPARFGIAVLGLDVNASDDTYRVERVEPRRESTRGSLDRRDARCRRRRGSADASAYGIRLSLADVKGISEAEVARIVAGQPVRRPRRLLAPGPGVAGRSSSGSSSPGGSTPSTAWRSVGGLGPARPGHPSRPAAARRRARPVGPAARGHRPRRSRRLGRAEHRARRPRGTGSRPRRRRAPPTSGQRAAAQSQAAARRSPPAAEQPTQLTLDLGDRPELVAGAGLPEMTGARAGARRARRARARRLARTSSTFYAPLLDALGVTRSADLLGAPQPQRGVGRRGQGRHPDPAGALGAPGRLPHPRRLHRPGRRDLLRGRPGPVRRRSSSTPGCCWCAGSSAAPVPRGVSMRATGAWELSGLLGRLAASAGLERGRAAAVDRRAEAEAVARRAEAAADRRRRAGRPRQPGRRVLVHASGFRQSPYADTRPPGESGRPLGAGARRPTRCPRASCGTPAPAAPDTRVGRHDADRADTDMSEETSRGRRAGPIPPRRRDHPGLRTRCRPGRPRRPRGPSQHEARAGPCGSSTSAEARAASPCRSPSAGHDVTVVDPSPDALASLPPARAETGTSARIHRRAGRHRHPRRARRGWRAPGIRPRLPPRHPRGRRRPGCRAGQHRGRARPRRHPLPRRRPAAAGGAGPRPRRAVRPGAGHPGAARRTLG